MSRIVSLRKTYFQSWEEVLSSFLLFRKAQGNSERTIEDYRYQVGHFFRSYPAIHSPELWENMMLRESVLSYLGKYEAPVTFNLRLSSLKIFFQWAINEGLLTSNPTEGLRKRKASPRIVNIPDDVLSRLLQLPDRRTFSGLRDYGLFLLQLDTGIRPGEALKLKVEDFDMKSGTINVNSKVSKTRTSRTLFLTRPTTKVLTELIAVRPQEWDKVPIFCTCEGQPFSTHSWGRRIIESYQEKVGMKITPYMLRHSFALAFLRNGGNIFALQRIMGHTSLEMTKRYLALTEQDIKEAAFLASPLNTLLETPSRKRVRTINRN